MIFCDPEYREETLRTLNISWADSLDALLTICRTTVKRESVELAGFFFSVHTKEEYVLGPHWGIESPFIRGGYHEKPWSKARDGFGHSIPAPYLLSSQESLHLLPLSEDLIFAAITGKEDFFVPLFSGGEFRCWNNLRKIIPSKSFDLSPHLSCEKYENGSADRFE